MAFVPIKGSYAEGYKHDLKLMKKDAILLPNLLNVISLVKKMAPKRDLSKWYQVNDILTITEDLYVFRFNWRTSESHKKLFGHLQKQAIVS